MDKELYPKAIADQITQMIVSMLTYPQTVPLDEMYDNIQVMIDEIQAPKEIKINEP